MFLDVCHTFTRAAERSCEPLLEVETFGISGIANSNSLRLTPSSRQIREMGHRKLKPITNSSHPTSPSLYTKGALSFLILVGP